MHIDKNKYEINPPKTPIIIYLFNINTHFLTLITTMSLCSTLDHGTLLYFHDPPRLWSNLQAGAHSLTSRTSSPVIRLLAQT